MLAEVRTQESDELCAFRRDKKALRAGGNQVQLGRSLMSVLMQRRRYRVAERLGRSLEALDGLTPALLRDLVETALARFDESEALALMEQAESLGERHALAVARFRKIAVALKAEKQHPELMAGVRHIAVAGVAFTGSTALGVILGSTPGFAHAGETQWLTQTRNESGEWVSISSADVDPMRWPVACRVCKRRCEVFNEEFRRSLAGDETGWYGKIAVRLGVNTLVTTDKNLYVYWEKDPLFRFDLIVLYKSPEQYLRSMYKQTLRHGKPAATSSLADPHQALDRWVNNYLGHLKTLKPTGVRIVLDWERFVAHPEAHLRRLGELLDERITPAQLSAIRLGHFIGGNIGIDVARLKGKPVFDLRPSDAPPLPDDLLAAVRSHRRSQLVEQFLASEYRRQFT